MAEREDFAAFAAARWPMLVRISRALGAPDPVAVEVATDALARVRRGWRRLRSQGDPDAEVLDVLLDAWRDACAARWWERHPAARGEPAAPGPLDRLDRLDRDEREALVLAHLGEGGATPGPSGPDGAYWQALRAAPVLDPAPSTGQVVAAARHARARRTRSWVARLVPATLVLVLVAGAAWALTRPDHSPLPEPRALSPLEVVVRVDTVSGSPVPSSLTWWADGALHLGAATVRLPGVQQVLTVTGGVVYADAAGRVVRITAAGTRILLGRTDDPLSVVASDDRDQVGWVDPRGGRHVVVVDAEDGTHRRALALPGGAAHAEDRPVAIGAGRVYVTGTGGSWSRPLAGGAATPIDDAQLLDVTGGLAVFGASADSGDVRVVRVDPAGEVPPAATGVPVPGDEAQLAPDAGYVLTRTVAGEVRIHVFGSGRDLATGVRPDEVALAAALGPQGEIAYVVARAADRPQAGDYVRSSFTGPAQVRTCVFARDLITLACVPVARVNGTASTPLLAR